MASEKKAIYAFSGDPITFGHKDIVERASNAFEELVVGIGVNTRKASSYTFTLEERKQMAEKALAHLPNVSVVSFEGLLVDYAFENKIPYIVKGVRNSVDVDFEETLHHVGASQKLGIDTFILFAKPELSHVSSSAVKELQRNQGSITEYVPVHVKQKLEERLSSQYIVGITGTPGSGKSYVTNQLVQIALAENIPAHNIELDFIGHYILGKGMEPAYVAVREQIQKTFGTEVMSANGYVNRAILGEKVFNDYSELKKLDDIMRTPMTVRLRRELSEKKGLILLNAALLAEANWLSICNNNTIVVDAHSEVQYERLRNRQLNEEQISRRLGSQYSTAQKENYVLDKIQQDNNGRLWKFDNSTLGNETNIQALYDSIKQELRFDTVHK